MVASSLMTIEPSWFGLSVILNCDGNSPTATCAIERAGAQTRGDAGRCDSRAARYAARDRSCGRRAACPRNVIEAGRGITRLDARTAAGAREVARLGLLCWRVGDRGQ